MTGENEQLKKMVNHLARVINQTLSTSPVVRKAVEAIRKDGYGIDLSLAACIGLYKEESSIISNSYPEEACEEIKFEFDQADLEFLKSLNLRITED